MAKLIDFAQLRSYRRKENSEAIKDALREGDMKKFWNSINPKELERLQEDMGKTFEEIIKECSENEMSMTLFTRLIAKKPSRQGTKDESIQIAVCAQAAQSNGIIIKQLGNKKIRPAKNGRILTLADIKNEGIAKNDCLKSFDAHISGRLTGFIAAKVVFGAGGHQDNVFEELETLGDWWLKHKHHGVLILLVDTDLTEKLNVLKRKFNGAVLVANHYDLQKSLSSF